MRSSGGASLSAIRWVTSLMLAGSALLGMSLRADGWVDACQTCTLTIVMVMWPGVDYHFYRLVTGASDW